MQSGSSNSKARPIATEVTKTSSTSRILKCFTLPGIKVFHRGASFSVGASPGRAHLLLARSGPGAQPGSQQKKPETPSERAVPGPKSPVASTQLNALLRPHPVDIAEDRRGQLDPHRDGGFFPAGRFVGFAADFFQLAGVEPAAAAAGALIDLDATLRAEVTSLEFDSGAFRAIAFARKINPQRRVALELDQPFAGGFAPFVHLLQFEGVEPDAATIAAADIHGEFSDGRGTELIGAGRAFHES